MKLTLTAGLLLPLLVACCTETAHAAADPDSDFRERQRDEGAWQSWKREHGKVYASQSEETRARAIWRRHAQFIQSHNSRADVTFTVALNKFADQESREELSNRLQAPLLYAPEVSSNFLPRAPPKSFDWRTKGAISPVQNQGQLGRSDVIAATEDLESLHFINTGQLVRLSEQEVADCCSSPQGEQVADVYECIHNHGGLCSESGYPSTGHPGQCKNDSCVAVADDARRTVHVPKGDEAAMVTAVLQCPLVVFVDASRTSFQLYKSGVYRDIACTDKVDHALQLVGYGQEATVQYWILKNSWGASWGMDGYILIERGVNMCGVANFAYYPQ